MAVTIKFVTDDGSELTETQAVHYLLQENKKLRERLDALEAKSEFTFPFFGASSESDTISFSAETQAAQEVPISFLRGEDIINFGKVSNDSWLD